MHQPSKCCSQKFGPRGWCVGEVGGSWASSLGWGTAQCESVPSTPSISGDCSLSGEPFHEGEPFSLEGLRHISGRVVCQFDDTYSALSTWMHKKELQQTRTRPQVCAQGWVQLSSHTETDKGCHSTKAHQLLSPYCA